MIYISQWLDAFLLKLGLQNPAMQMIRITLLLLLFILVSYIAFRITRFILRTYLLKLLRRSSFQWDNLLIEHKVLEKVAHLVPALLFKMLMPSIFSDYPNFILPIIERLGGAYIIITLAAVIISLLHAGEQWTAKQEMFKEKPISSYFQLFRIVIYIVVGILILSLLWGRSPIYFISAFGAMTAILMLIFKDTILGLVASVQISSNDMVRVGDWVEMPKFNADGDVVAINLNTVKVQNFDRTVTTIPTYYFITDSFKNWRGMQESGGRRIKRALYINLHSVKFASTENREHFSQFTLLNKYLSEKQQEIERYNNKNNIDTDQLINGRRMTNLGIFRKYIDFYLKNHPGVAQDMTILVRHLSSDAKGVPIEVYCFTNTTNWLEYEEIMGDIFDHLYASARYFDLDIFQEPSGRDVQFIGKTLSTKTFSA